MSLDLEKLDAAAKALKHLISEQKSYEKVRERARTAPLSKASKTSADMHYSALAVKRAQKAAWAAIVDADLEVSLDEQVAEPNGWHKVKI